VTSDPDGGIDDGIARREQREAAAAAVATTDRSPDLTDPDDATADDAVATKPAKSAQRNMVEWIVVIGGAVIIAVLVRLFVFQTFWIPSESMSPTLVKNDRVIVNKLSYKFHDIHRGDVVVFERPPNETANGIKDLIKRVIALPGERISLIDNTVRINGRTLSEPYVHGLPTVPLPGCGLGNVKGIDTAKGLLVPAHHIFVMGDNRVNSTDGRCFGPIDEDLVVGRAMVIMWPPGRAGGL
jgi:signal peptidase I